MKILVIEDQTMIRGLLVSACAKAVRGAEFAEAGNGAQALTVGRTFIPDLIILDSELPDVDGLDLIDPLRAFSPHVRVIALTSHTDEFTLNRAVQFHVQGFVDKNEQPLEVLHAAIEAVMAGRTYFSPVVERVKASLRADAASFTKLLSDHEQRLLILMGHNLTDEEIGQKLSLSPFTIKAHRRNIMGKLGLHSTPELMRYALEKGFIRAGQRQTALSKFGS